MLIWDPRASLPAAHNRSFPISPFFPPPHPKVHQQPRCTRKGHCPRCSVCRSLSTPGRAEFGQPQPPPPSHESDQDRNQLTQHSEPPAFPPVCPHVLPRLSEPTSSALRRGDAFRFGHRWLSAAFTRAAFIFLHQPGRSVKRKHLTCQSCEFPAARSHDPSILLHPGPGELTC